MSPLVEVILAAILIVALAFGLALTMRVLSKKENENGKGK